MAVSKPIQLVIVDEHTFGYKDPDSETIGVLHASVIRGSHFGVGSMIYPQYHNVRLARKEDFDVYRISFAAAYDTPEYEYDKVN